MKKALIISYSQAQQTETALAHFARGLEKNWQCEFMQIQSEEVFKFPWKISEFFRVFPRAVRGLSPQIKPLTIRWDDYDLVILGWQVWFLSPSLPIQGFLKSSYAAGLKNKKIITLVTCRNLWQSAAARVKQSLKQLGAEHLGEIVIAETSPVWASFVTTPRWMLTGKKSAFAFFPAAGIADSEFKKLESKGENCVRWIPNSNEWVVTQSEFGSNLHKVSLILMDQIGHRFFRIWSGLILKLAPRVGIWQDSLLVLFRLNLVLMIITIGPCTKLFELLVGNNSKLFRP